ncbi:hypothetical protein SAMN05216410_0970 [Sanguibacter gelidistatuariae]|uniref:Uncharacterized protein n=1 Tax=Sanguibacter gelidistatuariae TaxID=1814289 RepID=A0A1G6HFM0_9MICO|nr:hypothetical protein [Sanguibacter gelidistatuariae]SDB92735.1 hypothetical protein SAMN05216410_0970 [Sanguibacter gelidistatuariae]
MFVRLRKHPWSFLVGAGLRPVVTINGYTQRLPWGDTYLPIPDDAPVEIEVYVPDTNPRSFVTTIGKVARSIPPGHQRAVEYSAPAFGGCKGEMGPLGTTRTRGVPGQVVTVLFLGLMAIVVALGLVGAVVAAATGQR